MELVIFSKVDWSILVLYFRSQVNRVNDGRDMSLGVLSRGDFAKSGLGKNQLYMWRN